MDITLFISILTVGGAGITALLTEAIKTWYKNAHKEYSPNAIALINAFVIGGCGTAIVYMLKGIEWTLNNIICLILMIFAEWLISMVGYDKVSQLVSQVAIISAKKRDEDSKQLRDIDVEMLNTKNKKENHE